MNRFALVYLVAVAAACAQPSATMRPELLLSADATIGYSSRETIARGPADLGTVGVQHYAASFSGRHPWSDATTLVYGAAVAVHDLDLSSPLIPLPEKLTEFSLNLGVQHGFNARWSGAAYLRPGFYGSSGGSFEGDSFNAPFLAMVMYTPSRELSWSFGLNVNPFSDNPVLPIVGVRWQFQPEWTFSVGFPRTGVTWRVNEGLSLRSGVSFSGGSFRVVKNLGVPAPGVARLANTFLDFREIRVGVGLDYQLAREISFELDAGVVTDRKFDYFDRNYRLDGDGGAFVTVGLKHAF